MIFAAAIGGLVFNFLPSIGTSASTLRLQDSPEQTELKPTESNQSPSHQTEGSQTRQLHFNQDVRSILSENCFYCHGQDANQRQADLRLDQAADALEKGLVIPGDADSSQLIDRIMSDDPDLQMPPPDSNRLLNDQQKQILKTWINQGAKYETHWAFTTPQRSEVPTLPDHFKQTDVADWARNEIDLFVLDKLPKGLQPSPEADRSTLLKRLYIDLLGLPPTPQQMQEFLEDSDPEAYQKQVEKLLGSPHYGERMALPWLDAARYADSNGFQQDGDHWQWMWRDWLVQALNDDMPFDQFTVWQLAGDLLPDATTQQKIASGFNRNHMLNGEGGAIAEEQRWVNLFDRVDTTATTWLGLTMACAQCHDHKYDPITQAEYYQFLDAFNRVPETGVPQYISSRIRVGKPFLELPTEENKKHLASLDQQIADQQKIVDQAIENAFVGWKSAFDAAGREAQLQIAGKAQPPLLEILKKQTNERTEEEKQQLPDLLRSYFAGEVVPQLGTLSGVAERNRLTAQRNAYQADHIPRVMIMSDDQPRETHRLDRGQYLSPLEKVNFTTPQFLPRMDQQLPRNRLGLARWLVSDQHPLTARVQVNRIWQHFFGQGLVKTSEDFGVQSSYPFHKELLDWLAVEFRESGWSVKHIQRLILNSATYRQASHVSELAGQVDPANQYLARASRFRMPAMLLRDWALASSNLLDDAIGGAPVYPYQPDNVWESLAITKERDFTYPNSSGSQLFRRSLYTFWRRTVGPANMFDSSNRQTCRVRSSQTSTPLHALTTLNDPTWVEAARQLAATSWNAAQKDQTIQSTSQSAAEELAIAKAFQRVVCRPPTSDEVDRLLGSFQRWQDKYLTDTAAANQLLSVGQSKVETEMSEATHAALTVVCLTIFNLDEALNRE